MGFQLNDFKCIYLVALLCKLVSVAGEMYASFLSNIMFSTHTYTQEHFFSQDLVQPVSVCLNAITFEL